MAKMLNNRQKISFSREIAKEKKELNVHERCMKSERDAK